MKDISLKACPHCGGAATLQQNYSSKRHIWFVFGVCSICGAQGKIFSSDTAPAAEEWSNAPCVQAASAWNMRTAEQEALNNGKE